MTSSSVSIRSRFSTWASSLAASLVLLTACGGSDYDATAAPPGPPAAPAPPPAFVAESTSAMLGKGGGTVTLTTVGGTVYEFGVPAGALKSDTTFTLTTQAPLAGQRFNLKLQPAGLVFAQGKTATLLVTLPAGQTLPAAGGLTYRGVPIPFTTRVDAKLEIQLSALASGAAGAGATGGAEALGAVRPLATASAAACGAAPQLGANDPNGMVAADAIDVELYGQCMLAAVDALAANEQFQEAVKVSLSVAAYLQRTGSGDAAGFIARAASATCAAYSNALDRGSTTPVTGFGTLYQISKPIMFWENTRQQLGASCPGIAGTTYQHVINAKVNEAIAFYDKQKPAIVSTADANYGAAKTEARDSSQTATEVLALDPAPALRSTLDAEVVQRAQPSVIDSLLPAPWNSCRTDGSYDELIGLMRDLDAPAAVQSAAQYCGSQLGARARDASDVPGEDLAPNLGGVRAGYSRTSGSLAVPKDGRLAISGPVAALKCPSSSTGGDEALSIKLNTTVLQTLSPPYFASPVQIDMAQALQAAGLDPATVAQATLSVERVGAPCGGFWGENPAPLVQIDLSFKVCVPEAGNDFCITPVATGAFIFAQINAKGQVMLTQRDGKSSLWEAGVATPLAAEFADDIGRQWGALMDDGSIVGRCHSPCDGNDIAVIANGSVTTLFRGTRNSDLQTRTANDFDYQIGGAVPSAGLVFGTKSVAFFTITKTPEKYCTIFDGGDPTDGKMHRYYCQNDTLIRFTTTGAVVQEGPDFPYPRKREDYETEVKSVVPWAMNGSGTVVGRYSRGAPLIAVGSFVVQGVADPTYIEGDETYQFIDDAGAIYALSNQGGALHITGTVPFAPPLPNLGSRNVSGDVVSCSADSQQMQLTNLYSGKVLGQATAPVSGNGWTVSVPNLCSWPSGYQTGGASGGLDVHARSVRVGADAAGNVGRVVVTPRGKRLPKSTPG
jgi:hypothetical protein